MKTLLLFDRNRRTRREIRSSLLAAGHEVVAVRSLSAARKSFKKHKPDVVLVKTGAKDHDAITLLENRQIFGIRVPIVVLVGAGASGDVAKVRRLGATSVLGWPTRCRHLLEAVVSAGKTPASAVAAAPPITDDERQANLTQLEQRLNHDMRCFAGKNQVYIRSVIVGNGVTTKPRVALRCPLRAQFRLPPVVYYECIRDRCCDNLEVCPALRFFRKRQGQNDDSALPVPPATAEP